MKIRLRFLSLALAAGMLAGCADASPSRAGSSSESPVEQAAPVYTYVDPNPDMVLATLSDGPILYRDYRLYADVSERLDRSLARQDLALGIALEKDLAMVGIKPDEDLFKSAAAQQVLNNYAMPGYEAEIDRLLTLTDMTPERMTAAMQQVYRPQYLIGLLQQHYVAQAEKNFPVAAPPSASAVSAPSAAEGTADAASDAPSEAEERAVQAEQERQAAVVDQVNGRMDAYYDKFFTRSDFSRDDILVKLDGVEIPLTQEHRDFMEYVSMANRSNVMTSIQSGEAMKRELERKKHEADSAGFEEQYRNYVDSIQNAPEYLAELDVHLAALGATRDDYFASVRHALWLQYISYDFAEMLTAEYAALPADDPNRPADEQTYFLQRVNALLEGSELGNVRGK